MKLKKYFYLKLFILVLIVSFFLPHPSYGQTRYKLKRGATYQVVCRIKVANQGGTANNLVVRFSSFAVSGLPPYQKLISFRSSVDSLLVEKKNGEQLLVYKQKKLGSNQSIELELVYTFANWAIEYELSAYSMFNGSDFPEHRYLLPEEGIESESEIIKMLAKRLTQNKHTDLAKAKSIFRFVNDYFTYREGVKSGHSALKALTKRYGICEDFSLVYIAICRAAGIPARFVSGFRFEPKVIYQRFTEITKYAHAWVEIYLPVVGWVTVDPTFKYMVGGRKKVNYDFFGRIAADDRHLFYNYSRQQSIKSSWEYSPAHPAKIKTTTNIFIKRL